MNNNNNNSGGISHPIPVKPPPFHTSLQYPEHELKNLLFNNEHNNHHQNQHSPLLMLPQLPMLQLGGPKYYQYPHQHLRIFQNSLTTTKVAGDTGHSKSAADLMAEQKKQEGSKHPFVTEKLAGSDASALQRLFLLQQQHRQTQQQKQQGNQMIQNQQQFLPIFEAVGSNGLWLHQQQQHQAAFLMKCEQDQEGEFGGNRNTAVVNGDNVNDERVDSGSVIRCSTTTSSPPRAFLPTTSPTGVVVDDDKKRCESPKQPEQLQRTTVGSDHNRKTSTTISIINDMNKLFTNFATEEEKRSQNAAVAEKEQKQKVETTTLSIGSHSPPQAASAISMPHSSMSASSSSCSSSPPAPPSSSSSIGGEASSCKGAEGGWSFASSTTSSSSPGGRGEGETLSSSSSSSSPSSSSAKEEENPQLCCCCMKRRPTQINQNNQSVHSETIEEEEYQNHLKDARQQQHKRITEGKGEGENSATCQQPKAADSGVVSFLNNNSKEVPLGCDQCPVLEERLALSSSRLAYLDLCRLNCQNELLRLSARAALSDQWARKLEIESRQWKERSEMLTIRLLECREKVLALVGQQKQQQQLGGAPSSLWSPAPAEQLVQFQFLADVLKLTLV